MTAWNAAQYVKFEDERTRPVRDLAAAVPLEAPRDIVDLGCGPGNSTEVLTGRFPGATVTGMDSSPEMLAAARQRLPGIAFTSGDLVDWMPAAPVDLLFSNAVFQWVPDHVAVLKRLMSALKPGGVLAVQMPHNLDEPSHLAMGEAAAAGPWAAKIAAAGIGREPRLPIESYYDALIPRAARVDIWRTTYCHPLADVAAIIEWVKGTGLRPYLAPLDEKERAGYLADYHARLETHYPRRADGKVILRFPRLFVVATKS